MNLNKLNPGNPGDGPWKAPRKWGQAWFWAMPHISVVLFVLAMASFLWVLHKQDMEQSRNKLIRDTLWIEQSLRLEFDRNEDSLALLAREMAEGRLTEDKFRARAGALVAASPELLNILWVGEAETIRWAAPEDITGGITGERLTESEEDEAFQRAHYLNRPAYSKVFTGPAGRPNFEVHVPVYRGSAFLGTVMGVYSIQGMLHHLIPWWIAQAYQTSVVDADGRVVASKLGGAGGDPDLFYQIPFDPPGYGLNLRTNPYKTGSSLGQNMLVAVTLALSLVMVWSLWTLRKHMARRMKAEQALRAEYAFRKSMEDSMLTGMRAWDMEGHIIYVNRAFCNIVGWSEKELVGCTAPLPYWPPEERGKCDAAFHATLEGRAPAEGFELRLMRRNGERFDVILYEAPLIDGDGKQIGWMASLTDITERKRAVELARRQQEKLQFTARLVTMGEMASTLAHELNQPLSAIASYNTGCLNKLKADNFTREELLWAIEKVAAQARRAGKIIQSVRDFVRKSEPHRTACDINELVEETLGFAEIDARRQGVNFSLDLSPGQPGVFADRVMIEQVILNLVKNGIEAMRDVPERERELKISATPSEDDCVMVSVTDRGQGISPEIREKLFEPFFTTKREGMGMGLNICRSIVEFHNGRLWAEPNPGGGAVFRFTLPRQR